MRKRATRLQQTYEQNLAQIPANSQQIWAKFSRSKGNAQRQMDHDLTIISTSPSEAEADAEFIEEDAEPLFELLEPDEDEADDVADDDELLSPFNALVSIDECSEEEEEEEEEFVVSSSAAAALAAAGDIQ